MLHERAQAVAVRRHEHLLSGREARHDGVVPVRERAGHDRLEALRPRQQLGRQLRVTRIEARVPRIALVERRRQDRVAAPPLMELGVTVFLRRLLLVEAGQRAVVPLVQAPRALDGQPELVELLEDDLGREDRPRQERREHAVETEALRLQQPPGGLGFLDTLRGGSTCSRRGGRGRVCSEAPSRSSWEKDKPGRIGGSVRPGEGQKAYLTRPANVRGGITCVPPNVDWKL